MTNDNKNILKVLDEMLEHSIAVLRNEISQQDSYQKLMDLPKDQIPLRIFNCDKDSYEHHILSCRLKGVNPLYDDNLKDCIPLLWDCEFSVDNYKRIGVNDGYLSAISRIYTELGQEEKAKEALSYMYSDI